jgi:uncharacterized protein DUF4136
MSQQKIIYQVERSWGFLAIIITLILSSCNVYKEVLITKSKEIDFDKFKTYAWLPITDENGKTMYDNDFIRQKTRNYFGHCMSQRDFSLDILNPDILLQVEWLSQPKKVFFKGPTEVPGYYDAIYYDEYAPFYFFGRPKSMIYKNEDLNIEEREIEYAHGGVKLSIIEPKSNEIIWQGIAQGDLYDPEIMYQDLHPAIHKLMKKFPIKLIRKKTGDSEFYF